MREGAARSLRAADGEPGELKRLVLVGIVDPDGLRGRIAVAALHGRKLSVHVDLHGVAIPVDGVMVPFAVRHDEHPSVGCTVVLL